jgi:2-hydroxycyclohexanecarboxyl-CoA dehydrogenase
VGGLGAKTAVVTGGASGIGRAVAERLRSDGFRVAVVDLSPTGDGPGYVADVTDRAQVDAAISAIREALGPILVLVNAAGVEGFKKFSNMSSFRNGRRSST